MLLFDEGCDCLMGRAKVVNRKGVCIEYRHAPVEEDKGAAHVPRADEVIHLDAGGWRNNQAIDSVGEQHAHCVAFEFNIFVGGGQNHTEAICAGCVRDSPNGSGEIQILNIGYDDANHLAAASHHAAGKLVRLVSQALCGVDDALARVSTSITIIAKRPRCGSG